MLAWCNGYVPHVFIAKQWHTNSVNILRPWQIAAISQDNIFRCIFLNENVWMLLKISLKCVPKVRMNNIPTLVQIMAWHRPGDKPLSEPMIVSLLTHIYAYKPWDSYNHWFTIVICLWIPEAKLPCHLCYSKNPDIACSDWWHIKAWRLFKHE